MMADPTYDRSPRIVIDTADDACLLGWDFIAGMLPVNGRTVVECYPGAPIDAVIAGLRAQRPHIRVIDTRTLFRPAAAIAADLAATLTEDPVFGRFDPIDIHTYLDETLVQRARADMAGDVRIVGAGAAAVAADWDTLVHVSMARWELQLRQRRGEIEISAPTTKPRRQPRNTGAHISSIGASAIGSRPR